MGIEKVMAEEEQLERKVDFSSIFFCLCVSLFVIMMISFAVYCLFITLIDETCKKDSGFLPPSNAPIEDDRYFYSFCKSSLKAAPGSGRADLLELGLIAIRLLRENTTDTLGYIRQLIGKKGLDPSVKRLLENVCLVLYSAGVRKLTDEIIEEYKAKKFLKALIHVSTVLTSSTTCEDSFREVGLVSPLTKQNNDTKWLSLISLRIMDMLEK